MRGRGLRGLSPCCRVERRSRSLTGCLYSAEHHILDHNAAVVRQTQGPTNSGPATWRGQSDKTAMSPLLYYLATTPARIGIERSGWGYYLQQHTESAISVYAVRYFPSADPLCPVAAMFSMWLCLRMPNASVRAQCTPGKYPITGQLSAAHSAAPLPVTAPVCHHQVRTH